jgi:hypothetical protein
VISDSKHLISALHTVLSELEPREGPGRNEESLAELKRILNQRIQDLEDCEAVSLKDAKTEKASSNSD